VSEDGPHGDPWDRLDELTDSEVHALAEATLSVLREEAAGTTAADADIPPRLMREQLAAALTDEGLRADSAVVNQIASDGEVARKVSLAIVASIGRDTQFRQQIQEAYEARRAMMVVDGGLLIGAALLLLVTKLKRVQVEKGKFDVQFYQATDTLIDRLRRILGQG